MEPYIDIESHYNLILPLMDCDQSRWSDSFQKLFWQGSQNNLRQFLVVDKIVSINVRQAFWLFLIIMEKLEENKYLHLTSFVLQEI